jgi:hypothetical protein
MPTAEAQVATERPSRYLTQFCKHAAAMGGAHADGSRVHLHGMLTRREVQVQAEWSETQGIVTFSPWGQCTLVATVDTLTLRIDATDEENLRQIQEIITRDFQRFGRREHLTVDWHRPEAHSGHTEQQPMPTGKSPTRRHRRRMIVLAVAGALAVAVHLGLGGVVLANSRWTSGAADIVLAIVVGKVLLIVLGRLTIRRNRAGRRTTYAYAETVEPDR